MCRFSELTEYLVPVINVRVASTPILRPSISAMLGRSPNDDGAVSGVTGPAEILVSDEFTRTAIDPASMASSLIAFRTPVLVV
ncbi:MAG: hypothetical protein AMJ93_06245 [Anaerolineae bacterium SM23_84]|nr:MAG: hypothetical protein AMJ93_06245 [Anaerolineae bacterium SM23_84]